MFGKYYNYTEEDIQKIKEYYYIPQGTKELYVQDLNFILAYRSMLFNVVDKFWNAKSTGLKSDEEEAYKTAFKLAETLKQYIRTSVSANVMRKLVFIENIGVEIDTIQNAIIWLRRTYSSDTYKKTEKTIKALADFYTLVCCEEFIKDGLLDALENETAVIAAESMMADLSVNILNRIKPASIKENDVFYLLGYYLNLELEGKEMYDSIYKSSCAECTKDDCMVSHCKYNEYLSNKKNILENYKKLVKICKEKIKVGEVNSQQLQEVIQLIGDDSVRNITLKVLKAGKEDTLGKRKRLSVDWGREKNICIHPQRIGDVLRGVELDSSQSMQKRLLAKLILDDYDFSKATGQVIDLEFQELCQRYLKLKRECEEYPYGELRELNTLLLLYSKSNNNNDELGGE